MQTPLLHSRLLAARFLPQFGLPRGRGLYCFLVGLLLLSQSLLAQTITTVAGNGSLGGPIGDNGPATLARLNTPYGVAVDAMGNFYIADTFNNRIRKVTPAGIISTVAGTETQGFSGDGFAATSAELSFPSGVAVDAVGNLFIADSGNNRIRKVTPAGIISTVAGTEIQGFNGDDIAATSAHLNNPAGVAVDAAGNLFIADFNNNRIRKVTLPGPGGVISTVAGTGTAGFNGDDIAATSAHLNNPAGVAVDAAGNLYIVDSRSDRIRKVTLPGPGGVISTVAGNGTGGFLGDNGPATSARLSTPFGVAVDAAGNLFIADQGNSRIRKVTPGLGGIISTVAGGGGSTLGDGGPATSAELSAPFGVAVDVAGNLFIADTQNQLIRKVSVAIPCTDANLPTVTLVFNNSATVMGTGVPTITVPNTPGQSFQVLGGNSFERIIVIDRINGYEIRQTDRNTTGIFAINRLGLFSLTVTGSNGCSRTVQGILVNP